MPSLLGAGTNYRAELLSLWSLLWLARSLFCEDFLVFGDSLGIIDWINGKSTIRNNVLSHWYLRINQIRDTFTSITFKHLFREYNDTADRLSKDGLNLEEGTLMYKEVSTPDTLLWETLSIY